MLYSEQHIFDGNQAGFDVTGCCLDGVEWRLFIRFDLSLSAWFDSRSAVRVSVGAVLINICGCNYFFRLCQRQFSRRKSRNQSYNHSLNFPGLFLPGIHKQVVYRQITFEPVIIKIVLIKTILTSLGLIIVKPMLDNAWKGYSRIVGAT